MFHDSKKTIYYDNAVIKVYNLPIFSCQNYLFRPSVDRRSGFKSLLFRTQKFRFSLTARIFMQLTKIKFRYRRFFNEKPLFIEECHKLLEILILRVLLEGYKETTATKTAKEITFSRIKTSKENDSKIHLL